MSEPQKSTVRVASATTHPGVKALTGEKCVDHITGRISPDRWRRTRCRRATKKPQRK